MEWAHVLSKYECDVGDRNSYKFTSIREAVNLLQDQFVRISVNAFYEDGNYELSSD